MVTGWLWSFSREIHAVKSGTDYSTTRAAKHAKLKSVESLNPVHQAQILTYMKLAKKELGYLMNFNEKLLRNGVKRFTLRVNIEQ